jgi:myo-inositol-1(or 4)-monophosphatase
VGGRPPAGLLVSDESELLDVAVQAARTAGELLSARAHAGREQVVSAKSTPTDLVSDADRAAERAIRELLAERRPDDGYVGEESAQEVRGTSGLTWVVDPLDGTANFVFQIAQWSVSVAVRDGDGTVAGAVYDPSRGELFTATREGAARLRSVAGEQTLSGPAERELAQAMVATGLAYDAQVREAQAQVLTGLVGRVRDIRRFGSAALDLTWTAVGRYDAYYERTVKQWDIAAGALICRRAGLEVVELAAREGLPWGILVASPALVEPLLQLVG